MTLFKDLRPGDTFVDPGTKTTVTVLTAPTAIENGRVSFKADDDGTEREFHVQGEWEVWE